MEELENYFKALADISRLRIVNLLFCGELCVCDIQYVLDAPQPNVSRHLSYLKHAGLVRDRREGFRVFYGLLQPPSGNLQELLEFLRAAFQHDRALRDDLVRLKRAIKNGACTLAGPQGPVKISAGSREVHARG
jgi:ArsR family transcriptional regulator